MANSFINKKADLTTTDLTTLYTVPSFKTAVVKSILVSEDAGSGASITVTLVDASSNIFSLFKASLYLQILQQSYYLNLLLWRLAGFEGQATDANNCTS